MADAVVAAGEEEVAAPKKGPSLIIQLAVLLGQFFHLGIKNLADDLVHPRRLFFRHLLQLGIEGFRFLAHFLTPQ